MTKFFSFSLAFFTLFISDCCFSQGSPSGGDFNGNPIQTAVPFLRISPDARSGAMGDVGLALSPDANAVFWNSAKLPFTEANSGIALAYTPWLANLDVNDIHLINVGGYTKLDDEQALNASIKYFSLGETQFRRTAQDPEVTENPQEFAVQFGYSRKLSEITGLGVNLKYISSDLARNQGSQNYKVGTAVAGDVNFFVDPISTGNADFAFAATISNIGSKISYVEGSEIKDFLPTNFGVGANVDLEMDDVNSVSFALDANKLLVPTPENVGDTSFNDESVINALFSSWGDAPGGFSEELQEFQVSLGGEYNYNDQFFGRAGYFYENDYKGGRQYATLGAGVTYEITTFNFAYLFSTNNSNSPLDKTLRLSLEFDIN